MTILISAVAAAEGDHTQDGLDGGVAAVEGWRSITELEREAGLPMTGRERGGNRREGRDSKTPRDR